MIDDEEKVEDDNKNARFGIDLPRMRAYRDEGIGVYSTTHSLKQ